MKPFLTIAIAIVMMFGVIALASSKAQANVYTNEFNLQYTVYAGGLHVMNIFLNFDMDESKYAITMDTELHGLLGKVVPWRGVFETKGIRLDNGQTFQPLEHKALDIWNEEVEERVYKYNKDGKLTSITIVKDGAADAPLKEKELTEGTIDMLSMVAMMIVSGDCTISHDLFDGKRRFTTEFRGMQDTLVRKSKYNIYQGEADLCESEIIPKGGKWHKKPRGWLMIQEQARDKGKLPYLNVAYDFKGIPAIPVKGFVNTNYGAFLLHLKNIEFPEKQVTASSE